MEMEFWRRIDFNCEEPNAYLLQSRKLYGELDSKKCSRQGYGKKDQLYNCYSPEKPVAAFSASPTSGKAPLKVTFTDKSTGSPTSWKWSFGDKTYSTAKNPVHKYTAAGKYTVSLTVKNAAGSNTKTMSGYIKVSKK